MTEKPKKGRLPAFPSFPVFDPEHLTEHDIIEIATFKQKYCEWKLEHETLDAELEQQIEELTKYKVFYDHIKVHFEKEHPDWLVECKICEKDFEQIIQEHEEKKKELELGKC